MKREITALSQGYARMLRKHVERASLSAPRTARALGRQAVSLGLETRDLARIHKEAVATLDTGSTRDGVIRRAKLFFIEANVPVEKVHHAAVEANGRLSQLTNMLGERALGLAASGRSLKKGIARRKKVEAALKKSGGNSKKLLRESHRLQQHLRHLTHQLLSAQEEKRKRIGRDLQDEIAQTLLGINVRLISLRAAAAADANGLAKKIASTLRIVDLSLKTMKRFARGLGYHP
jgi:signal transduction histidine kinase